MNHSSQRVAPGHALFLLAVCAGLGVANVYYLQPSLFIIQSDLGVSSEQVGWLPTATQLSYALGMLLLAPLGDVIRRRRLILAKSAVLVVALLAAWRAPTLAILILSSAVVGLLGSVGQDFVPAAAQLAPEKSRGRAVGTVTMGLLSGILLSRTLGGWVADLFGWREMQLVAAGLMLVVMMITSFAVPDTEPAHSSSYGALLGSLWTFWRDSRELRLSVIVQALLAATLGAFWSCLALVLAAPPFQFGAGVAGSYGIAGVVGALAAPMFGHLADRRGPLLAIRVGCAFVIVAFVGMTLAPPNWWIVAIGAVLFDLGVMAGFVSHQALVSGINPQARSRLNGLLMTGATVGMAAGAAIGNLAWARAGSAGLFGFAALAGVAALLFSFLHQPFSKAQHAAANQ
jgi:predicted MFS family arabinose efflux permease